METKKAFATMAQNEKTNAKTCAYWPHKNLILLLKHNREMKRCAKFHFSLESTGVLILE